MGLQWPTAATRQGASPLLPRDIERLRGIADDRDVAAGTKLLRAGQVVDRVLVVGSAVVELRATSRTGRRVAAVVRRGGVIADIPLLLSAPMPFDAVVSSAGSVCELSDTALLRFLGTSPEVSLRWMRSIAVRLDEERRRMHALATTDLRGQTALVLLEHAEGSTSGPPAVRLSHDVIADLLGARRQSVSRVIAAMRDDGAISSRYRQTVLLDLEALRRDAGLDATPWLESAAPRAVVAGEERDGRRG